MLRYYLINDKSKRQEFLMIEKVAKSERTSNLETWHRFKRSIQLRNIIKKPFRRILDKKIRQLRRGNDLL